MGGYKEAERIERQQLLLKLLDKFCFEQEDLDGLAELAGRLKESGDAMATFCDWFDLGVRFEDELNDSGLDIVDILDNAFMKAQEVAQENSDYQYEVSQSRY